MEYNSKTKQVTNWLVLCFQIFEIDYFRSHIARRPTAHKQVVALVAIFSQPKIGNDAVEVTVSPEEDVFRFEVSMHDAVGVHNFQSFKDALHDHFDFEGGELMSVFDFIIKLPSFQQFHTDIDRVVRLVDSKQSHQILMIELSHDFDFVDEGFPPLLFCVGGLLREGLDCILVPIFMLVD